MLGIGHANIAAVCIAKLCPDNTTQHKTTQEASEQDAVVDRHVLLSCMPLSTQLVCLRAHLHERAVAISGQHEGALTRESAHRLHVQLQGLHPL
jgi:hypothetical protein